MGDFASSFSSSLEKTSATGAAGAMELIKEKIKKNSEQRQSEAIFDVIHSKMSEDAVKKGASPDDLKNIEKKISGLQKAGLSPTEAMAAGKLMAPDAFMSDEAMAVKQGNLDLRKDLEQDRLEQRLKQDLNAPLEKGTGVIGIANRNVDLAVKARTLIDQNTDPKTGVIKIPKSAHIELATSLAALLSPNNQGAVAQQMIEGLQQKTAAEVLNTYAIYLGADPKEMGGSTQSVLKYFRENIDRLGLQNEDLRDEKVGSLINQSYSNLKEDSRKRISENLPVSSFKNYLGMTPYQSSVSESLKTPTFDSLEALNAAKLPKGTKVKVGKQSGVVS